MDGIHDMGGDQGWGQLHIDPDEELFAHTWQERAFALGNYSSPITGTNIDTFRHALERLHPIDYLSDGYYGRWLRCAELLCVEAGLLAPGAVDARARQLAGEDVPDPAPVKPNLPDYEAGGRGALREIDTEPRYSPGQVVTTQSHGVPGHTRLPAYVRGRVGTIVAIRPAAVLPDTNAHFEGENPQYVYTVEYSSTELWGPDAEPSSLRIDLYESYLEVVT